MVCSDDNDGDVEIHVRQRVKIEAEANAFAREIWRKLPAVEGVKAKGFLQHLIKNIRWKSQEWRLLMAGDAYVALSTGQVFSHHLSLRETGFEKGNVEISSSHSPSAPCLRDQDEEMHLFPQVVQGSRSAHPSLSLEQILLPEVPREVCPVAGCQEEACGGGLPWKSTCPISCLMSPSQLIH